MPHVVRVEQHPPCRRDVLSWVIPRQEPIKALRAEELNTSHDLSSDELKFLSVAVAADEDVASPGERCRARLFWTMATLLQPLADWGHNVVSWLAACPCPKPCEAKRSKTAGCVLKGARAISLACGKMADFINQLHATGVSHRSMLLMRSLERSVSSQLLTEFNSAKSRMLLRVQQSFGFWSERPWSILRMAECLQDEAGTSLSAAFQRSLTQLRQGCRLSAVPSAEAVGCLCRL